jgi:opacity protein-like surface antigen
MMKRQWVSGVLAGAALVALTAGSAGAQVVQVGRGDARNAIGFTLGGFFLPDVDSRSDDDTLRADLLDTNPLDFQVKDFNHVVVGGEYLFGVSDYLEVGVGASFYQKSVPSVYKFLVNTNGSEIAQDLKLRIVPITATIRFLPVGRSAPVEPYVGAGIGIFAWRYSETGDFVDSSDNSVFTNSYSSDGVAFGPVVLGGLRIPVGDALLVGGEVRWQKAQGKTGGLDEGFLGDKIDLDGVTANFTIHFRF